MKYLIRVQSCTDYTPFALPQQGVPAGNLALCINLCVSIRWWRLISLSLWRRSWRGPWISSKAIYWAGFGNTEDGYVRPMYLPSFLYHVSSLVTEILCTNIISGINGYDCIWSLIYLFNHQSPVINTVLPCSSCARIFNEENVSKFCALLYGRSIHLSEYSHINDPADCFNWIGLSSLNIIAPLKVRSSERKQPWMNVNICSR